MIQKSTKNCSRCKKLFRVHSILKHSVHQFKIHKVFLHEVECLKMYTLLGLLKFLFRLLDIQIKKNSIAQLYLHWVRNGSLGMFCRFANSLVFKKK
jgi:hypothetical protein